MLPATSVPETWVVLNAGCISTDPQTCPDNRGGTYNISQSKTWKNKDFFELGVELNLGYNKSDAGQYGFDRLGLGYEGSAGPSLDNQVIAGIAIKEFYLGILGLTPRPINFTTEDTHPSLLSNLKTQNLIPSLSFGYSAGAQYRKFINKLDLTWWLRVSGLKQVEGSLTLGGYDTSRFTPNDVDFTFASDISRDLVVGLQSIKYSDSKATSQDLLSEGILAFIDSTVPHIWLPLSACQAFEKAFGLNYDNESGLYLVDSSLHETLLAQNANITFTLGNEVDGGKTVDIVLPYLSFDLQAVSPFVKNSSRYFPLRRAVNDTQFTLGRTFFQESYVFRKNFDEASTDILRYLIVDYERSNFSVSQAIFLENAQQNLVPIRSINDTSQNITVTKNNPPSRPAASHKLSSGTIVGIVIAVVISCILVLGAIFFVIRRRRRDRERLKAEEEARNATTKPELDAMVKPVVGELYSPHGEADSREAFKPDLEMEGSKPMSILDAKNRRLVEVEGTTGGAEMEGSRGGVEMETGHPAAVELDAGPFVRHELASSDTGTSGLNSPSGTRDPASRLPSPDLRNKSLSSPTTGNTTPPPPPPQPGSSSSARDPLLVPTPDIRPEQQQPPSRDIEQGQRLEPSSSPAMTPGRPPSSGEDREGRGFMERMRWSSRRRRTGLWDSWGCFLYVVLYYGSLLLGLFVCEKNPSIGWWIFVFDGWMNDLVVMYYIVHRYLLAMGYNKYLTSRVPFSAFSAYSDSFPSSITPPFLWSLGNLGYIWLISQLHPFTPPQPKKYPNPFL